MKIFVIVLAVIISALFFPIETISAANIQLKTGFHYDWWDDTKDDKASQTYVPVRIEWQHQDFSLSVLTGYADTHIEQPGIRRRSLSDILDTKVNFSYEISGKMPVDVFIGLDFNLPTGKTNLKQEDLVLIMDPDLISINNFGEGFNINPTLSMAKEWKNWVVGIGIGYVWRGEYDYSENIKDYNPGDIFNTNAELRYYFYDWNARLFGGYVRHNTDKIKDADSHREGDYYSLGFGLNYTPQKWDVAIILQSIFRNKSKFQEAAGGLFTEANKSYGDEWVGDISLKHFLDDKTAIKSFIQGLFITKNDYPSDSPFFVGRREKFSLGLGTTRTFSPHIEGELNIKGFVMHDAEAQFPLPKSARSYRGISTVVHLVSRF